MTRAHSLIDLIGGTPLLELNNFSRLQGLKGKILAKAECFNPAGSIKDRVGYALISRAEEEGLMRRGTVIIEPTSGNTGIGLALVAAVKGYRLILVMPENMSEERKRYLSALGAELVLTPGSSGMRGAIKKAEELAGEIPGAYMPQQFNNPANPEIHRKTTAREIWQDAQGQVDFFVAGVGTGGTITGVGEALKANNPAIKIIAVEPQDSPVLSGGLPGPHLLQGIGAGFFPPVLNLSIIDEVIPVGAPKAYETARALAKSEGFLVGISSGAAAYAALLVAQRPSSEGKTIVVILPDSGEKYLSTDLFS